MKPLLVSNSFPFALIRREVLVTPSTPEELQAQLRTRPWKSAWGHSNTLAPAAALAGADLSPSSPRPAIRLSPDNLPTLDGEVFDECWLLSPEYVEGFRPSIGEEVPASKIRNWQVLKIIWTTPASKT